MVPGAGTRTPRRRRDRSVGARSSGGEAMDEDGYQLVGKGRGGRWADGPPQHAPNPVAKGGGKKGTHQQHAENGQDARQQGKGAQPPDVSGAQQEVERQLWMVKEAKDRAEWFLAYYKPKDDEKAFFERI